MNRQQAILAAHGLTDSADRLISADEPLAELQECCGGRLPGTLAVPELLDLVHQSRRLGLRIAREFRAFDGVEMVTGFARIHPLSAEEGGGCEILIENWHTEPQGEANTHEITRWLDAIDRASAEITARLDARQKVQFLTARAADAQALMQAVEEMPGQLWSEYVALEGVAHEQPLHWRLLDGALAKVPGSDRNWRARLLPVGPQGLAPCGFELLLLADEPLAQVPAAAEIDVDEATHSRLIGSALTPVLKKPIARIIANAESIRARLSGPLRDDYSEYAGFIAAAGQHLSGMLDDLADLEVVEAPDFATASERVDLADVASRAAGILGVRAQRRSINVRIAEVEKPVIATGEFRRVLQILINLIGNAIAYSPEGSEVTVRIAQLDEERVAASVIDQGPGVSEDQAHKIFDKFERLGRDSDGESDSGSGLGLYISRKLAQAMNGELEILRPAGDDNVPGAEFRLTLPRSDQA